jgi:uroporphyrinogen-III synthase
MDPEHPDRVWRAGPLTGRSVALTRPAEGAAEFADRLRQLGARPVLLPLIAVRPPEDRRALEQAAARLASYDWIVFTSANAVRSLAEVLARTAGTAAGARIPLIAAVGTATAAAVATSLGWRADVVPEEYTGGSLTPAMEALAPLRGARVLWPRAAIAREALPRDLAAAGAVLDDPPAYETVADPVVARELARQVACGDIDVLTFTSPSAVSSFAAQSPGVGDAIVAVIGPATAATARQNGLPVHVEPQQHTISALIEALVQYLQAGGGKRHGQAGDA